MTNARVKKCYLDSTWGILVMYGVHIGKVSNLSRIVLWRWWFELEVNFIQRQSFKSLAQGWSAHFKETKMDGTLRWTYWQSMAWFMLTKLKCMTLLLYLILSIGMPYYQEECITRCIENVSVLKYPMWVDERHKSHTYTFLGFVRANPVEPVFGNLWERFCVSRLND